MIYKKIISHSVLGQPENIFYYINLLLINISWRYPQKCGYARLFNKIGVTWGMGICGEEKSIRIRGLCFKFFNKGNKIYIANTDDILHLIVNERIIFLKGTHLTKIILSEMKNFGYKE